MDLNYQQLRLWLFHLSVLVKSALANGYCIAYLESSLTYGGKLFGHLFVSHGDQLQWKRPFSKLKMVLKVSKAAPWHKTGRTA